MSNPHLSYRPEIDGLRALAVLSVVIYHARIDILDGMIGGGYIGVDIFFVISGFLVTSLINRGLQENQFSLSEFWARRIARILPAMTVVILATLTMSALVDTPSEFQFVAQQTLAQSVSLSNIYFYLNTGYFQEISETFPLLHMWSLAVEEQFYILFPPLLLLLQHWQRRSVIVLLTLLTLMSFAGAVYGSYFDPSLNFYLLPTRAWELLCGSLVAYAAPLAPRSRFNREILALVGLLAMLLPIGLLTATSRFPGWNALSPVLGASVYILAHTHGSSLVGRLFSLQPIVFLGLISYSLYLWHWPVLVYFNALRPFSDSLSKGLCVGIVVMIAAISWRYIEVPIRQLSKSKTPSWSIRRGIIALCGLAVIATGIYQQDGFPQRLTEKELQLAEFFTQQKPPEHWFEEVDAVEYMPRLGPDVTQTSPSAKFVLWGDSHAISAAMAAEELACEFNQCGILAAKASMIPLPGFTENHLHDETEDWKRLVEDFLLENQEPRHVILIARWMLYIDNNARPTGRAVMPTETESLQWIEKHLEKLIKKMQEKGKLVWIVGPLPEQSAEFGRFFFGVNRLRPSLNTVAQTQIELGVSRQKFEEYAGPVQRVLKTTAEANGAIYIDPSGPLFQQSDDCLTAIDMLPLYYDDDHLSRRGATFVMRPALLPIFQQMVEEARREAERTDDAK